MIPIACTLDAAEARAQVTEWQLVLHDAVARHDVVSPTRAELALNDSFDNVSALVNLMQRETRCCPFFHFALDVSVTELVMVVEVPTDASSVLASFIDAITLGTQ